MILFRFWADKAAITADFHLRNGTCYYEKQRIARTAGVCTLCDFSQNTALTILQKICNLYFACYFTVGSSKQCTVIPQKLAALLWS